MSIKLTINIPHTVQFVVAILSAVAAVGTQVLADTHDIVPEGWAAPITSILTSIAAVAGFLKKAEPILGDIDKL